MTDMNDTLFVKYMLDKKVCTLFDKLAHAVREWHPLPREKE